MKKIIYAILIAIVVIGTGILIVKYNITEEEPVKEEETCHSITGGSFNVTFNTNSDVVLENVSVCIACPPDTYAQLPVLTKAGYTFDGWYYDSEFTKKVEGTTTLSITSSPIYEKNCIKGYNNVTLHAKWNLIDKH